MSCLYKAIKLEIFVMLAYLCGMNSGIINSLESPYSLFLIIILLLQLLFGFLHSICKQLARRKPKDLGMAKINETTQMVPISKEKYPTVNTYLTIACNINEELDLLKKDPDNEALLFQFKKECKKLYINLKTKK